MNKKQNSFLKTMKKNMVLVPIFVVFSAALQSVPTMAATPSCSLFATPAWPSLKWPSENEKWPIAEAEFDSCQLPQNDNGWQYMGKVDAATDIHITSGGKGYRIESETAYLYSRYDGERMRFRIYIPNEGKSYDVEVNKSYDGSTVQWTHSGNRVTYLPPISRMRKHCAGPYYLDM